MEKEGAHGVQCWMPSEVHKAVGRPAVARFCQGLVRLCQGHRYRDRALKADLWASLPGVVQGRRPSATTVATQANFVPMVVGKTNQHSASSIVERYGPDTSSAVSKRHSFARACRAAARERALLVPCSAQPPSLSMLVTPSKSPLRRTKHAQHVGGGVVPYHVDWTIS